jgi:5-methylcytosine-specific restriction protein A
VTGWEGSDRRARLPANWPRLRAKRLEIDGHRCTWRLPSGKRCPRAATEVDHKVAMSDDHRIQALQSLCSDHHAKKTVQDARKGKAAKKASRRRPPEDPPGRLR